MALHTDLATDRRPPTSRDDRMAFPAVLTQIALGIWTLLAVVPISLGLAHQAGAIMVFAIAILHLQAMLQSTRSP